MIQINARQVEWLVINQHITTHTVEAKDGELTEFISLIKPTNLC